MTTMTSAATAPSSLHRPGFWRRYGAMWARTWREVVAIIGLHVIAIVGFGLCWALFASGIGTLPVFLIGIFVIAAALYAARFLGEADLVILEWTGQPRIARPAWPSRPGFMGWLRSVHGGAHYWLRLLYFLLPKLVVAVASFAVTTAWLGVALGGTFWGAWGWAVRGAARGSDRYGGLAWVLHRWLGGDQVWLEAIIQTVLGLAFLFVLPWVARGLTSLQWWVARGFLGGFRSEALAQDLAATEASRSAAVAAEDSAIRRLERDIHDGPQQRLIRLQMDLASAERRLADDPDAARALIGSAADQAREALEELRAVSRGIAPPILLDRGLLAALESAAVRSPVPTTVVGELPVGLALRPELERNAYFIASEAMTNAVKHAAATRVEVRVAVVEGRLRVEVTDDGRGGATSIAGHGLAGLDDRARGLGGTLSLLSPAGGPTTVVASLPLHDGGRARPGTAS